MNDYYLRKPTIWHRLKFILLLALLGWIPSSYGSSQELKGKNAREVLEKMTQLLTPVKPINEPTDLLIVVGYLRLFAPSSLTVENSNLIALYVKVINYYPYNRVVFTRSTSDLLGKCGKHFLKFKQLSDRVSASILGSSIDIEREQSIRNQPLNISFAKHSDDHISQVVALKEKHLYCSLAAVTEEGLLCYFVLDEVCNYKRSLHLRDLSDYGNIRGKISLCSAPYHSSFLLLVNLDTPILRFYQGVNDNITKREMITIDFDTSDWYKYSKNNFDDLEFLGKDHFLIVNYHPELGGRLFLYCLHTPKPVGYLSLDQKYTNMMRFSCHAPNLCFYSKFEPSMLIFDYTQQAFIHLVLPCNLCPLKILDNTKQLIMGYTSSQESYRRNMSKTQKVFLCNLIGGQVTIQDEFLLKGTKQSNKVGTIWKHQHNSLVFSRVVKIVDYPNEKRCFDKKVFELKKYLKDSKTEKTFPGIKFC